MPAIAEANRWDFLPVHMEDPGIIIWIGGIRRPLIFHCDRLTAGNPQISHRLKPAVINSIFHLIFPVDRIIIRGSHRRNTKQHTCRQKKGEQPLFHTIQLLFLIRSYLYSGKRPNHFCSLPPLELKQWAFPVSLQQFLYFEWFLYSW